MVYKEIIGDANKEKERHNFRLRYFNTQYKIMLDSYTGRENESLQQLKIYPMRTLALEEKLENEVFEDYDPNSIQIKINFWREGLEALTEEVLQPISIKVKKDLPMSEFMLRLAQENNSHFGQEVSGNDLVVLKRNPLLNTSHLELLSDQREKLLS
jgi:hypothetical protein